MMSFAQLDEYQGFIRKSPIHLVLDIGDNTALYSYDKYDTPIILNVQKQNDDLVLNEMNDKYEPVATITLNDYFKGDNKYLIKQTGTWKSLVNGKSYKVLLKHAFDFTNSGYSARPILIFDSNKKHYFKRVLSNNEGKGIEKTDLRIYEKGTDNLIQTFPDFWSVALSNFLYEVSTGDYNFDGYDDFSVTVETFAGSNTRSQYYLWNPKTKQYHASDKISGISLEFDQKKKRIYEINRSSAGRYKNVTTYKLDKNNNMINLGTACYELDFTKTGNEYVLVLCTDE